MTQTTTRDTNFSEQQKGSLDPAMQECIDNCLKCSAVCNSTLTHCLQLSGKHVESSHIKTLIACADICALSAQWMIRDISFHSELCRACAEACKACAQSCLAMGDDQTMQECADSCKACAESCAKMAAH